MITGRDDNAFYRTDTGNGDGYWDKRLEVGGGGWVSVRVAISQ